MNKSQGLAVGAILAASLMFRPGVSTQSHVVETADEISGGHKSLTKSEMVRGKENEGPWIASCKYWSPARSEDVEQPKKTVVGRGLQPSNSQQIDLFLHLDDTGSESGCGQDGIKKWGVPEEDHPFSIQAIIATVPDPVHTHLALAFDRTVDAILQAAARNDYVSSSYWLPWRQNFSTSKGLDFSEGKEPGHDAERERQPGLVILKHVPTGEGDASPAESYYKIIYLFLVAETPTQGVDGFQLRKAFAYEDELDKAFRDSPSDICSHKRVSRGRDCGTSIIGPMYTGSAASLRVGLEEAQKKYNLQQPFNVTGATSTQSALDQLEDTSEKDSTKTIVHYISFDTNSQYDEDAFVKRLKQSGYKTSRMAELNEENTALGDALNRSKGENEPYFKFRFPREISLLRNAQVALDDSGSNTNTAPSPYLRLSAKDSSAQDSVPQFSRENTPVSQEAQLMAIGRQLQRERIQFIFVTASNNLDQVFLARFLHRVCPDARLIFLQPDLMMVRDVDDIPFIGSITISPFPLIAVHDRAYSDAQGAASYNAASYTFWDGKSLLINNLHDSYSGSLKMTNNAQADDLKAVDLQPVLWATVIGSDGYYPLGVLSPCGSNQPYILPSFNKKQQLISQNCDDPTLKKPNLDLKLRGPYPASKLWATLNIFVSLLCLVHTVMLLKADYWSPLTHNVAISDSAEPALRSVYVQVAGVILFLMTYAVSFPVVALGWMSNLNMINKVAALGCLACGLLALITSTKKTWEHVANARSTQSAHKAKQIKIQKSDAKFVWLMYGLAWLTLLVVGAIWTWLCTNNSPNAVPSYLGLSFSFRCIHPGSGVSPLIPILALLFSWHMWALLQTARLRFARGGRPMLVGKLEDEDDNRYFVPYEDLGENKKTGQRCLYENITEAFLTTRLFPRLAVERRTLINFASLVTYTLLPASLSCFCLFNGMDHFLWGSEHYRPSPYEVVIGLLFYPLLVMAVSGWARMLMVWTSLRRGLLDRLENQPIRVAFSRMKGIGWMTLLRQGSVEEQWRDMARSVESMRQMLNREDMKTGVSEADLLKLESVNKRVLEHIHPLRKLAAKSEEPSREIHAYEYMAQLEDDFAEYGRVLLSALLIPYWKTRRTGLVEGDQVDELPLKARRSEMHADGPLLPMELHAGPPSEEPALVVVAEEFIAIRYMTLIRAVLANMRYLMAFVLAFFVLSIVGWNSYPFQPQLVDWLFTGLLGILIAGVIWVFAQMHRNAILSRVTDTKSNELGWDFYLRVIAFGAIPVLAWLAYQFPEVGNVIYRFVQPGVSVLK